MQCTRSVQRSEQLKEMINFRLKNFGWSIEPYDCGVVYIVTHQASVPIQQPKQTANQVITEGMVQFT